MRAGYDNAALCGDVVNYDAVKLHDTCDLLPILYPIERASARQFDSTTGKRGPAYPPRSLSAVTQRCRM